jgi:hypothetical protein
VHQGEVFCTMMSKYAMALYETPELRRNLDRCIETFTIQRFRELMSVKSDAYRKSPEELVKVIRDPIPKLIDDDLFVAPTVMAGLGPAMTVAS